MKYDMDKFAPGVMVLGILGGVGQFISAMLGSVVWSVIPVTDVPVEAMTYAVLVASILSITGAAISRGAPMLAFYLLWFGVILGAPAPLTAVPVLIAAIIHTVGLFRTTGHPGGR